MRGLKSRRYSINDRASRAAFAFGIAVVLVAPRASAQSTAAPQFPKGCPRQGLAPTMNLAYALDNVRGAHVLAEGARRRALAELDIALVQRIEDEPDTLIRRAAWRMVGTDSIDINYAETRREADEKLAALESASAPADYQRLLDQWITQDYRYFMHEVVAYLDPRCAPNHEWDSLYAQAVRAEAL